jgi:hypothetical protein
MPPRLEDPKKKYECSTRIKSLKLVHPNEQNSAVFNFYNFSRRPVSAANDLVFFEIFRKNAENRYFILIKGIGCVMNFIKIGSSS